MPPKVKTGLFVFALIILSLHGSLLLLYSLDKPAEKKRLNYWADYYVYPFFQQGWQLFAPAPTSNYKLFVWQNNNGQEIKQELISDCLLKHHNNLLGGREALLLSLCNSAHMFEKTTMLRQKQHTLVNGDLYFDLLEQQALRYLNHKSQSPVKACKLALYVHDFVKEKEYVYYNSAFLK